MGNELQLDRVAAAVTPKRVGQAGPWNQSTPPIPLETELKDHLDHYFGAEIVFDRGQPRLSVKQLGIEHSNDNTYPLDEFMKKDGGDWGKYFFGVQDLIQEIKEKLPRRFAQSGPWNSKQPLPEHGVVVLPVKMGEVLFQLNYSAWRRIVTVAIGGHIVATIGYEDLKQYADRNISYPLAGHDSFQGQEIPSSLVRQLIQKVDELLGRREAQAGPWNKDTQKHNPYATWIDWCPNCGGDLYVTELTLMGNNERLTNMKVPFHQDGFDMSDDLPDYTSDWSDFSTEDEVVTCEGCAHTYQTADLHVEDHPRKKPRFAQAGPWNQMDPLEKVRQRQIKIENCPLLDDEIADFLLHNGDWPDILSEWCEGNTTPESTQSFIDKYRYKIVGDIIDTQYRKAQMHAPLPPPPAAIVQQHQPQQWEIVAACLIAEAGGEQNPSQAMTAVMDVIVNRSKKDPSKFAGVVTAKSQFSCTAGGVDKMIQKASRHAQWPVAVRIVQMASAGNLPDITGGATSYANLSACNPSWAHKLHFIGKIGNHSFFK